MSDAIKKVHRTQRSLLGEFGADLVNPIGAHQVKQEDKGIAFEKQEEDKAAAVAEALAGQAAGTAPQTLIEPEPMPTSDDARSTRRRSRRQQLARRGRASTILTSYDDALGGET